MEIVMQTVLFEHEKTGAKLFYIQSKDIDRSFEVAFRTPAVDNTGEPYPGTYNDIGFKELSDEECPVYNSKPDLQHIHKCVYQPYRYFLSGIIHE